MTHLSSVIPHQSSVICHDSSVIFIIRLTKPEQTTDAYTAGVKIDEVASRSIPEASGGILEASRSIEENLSQYLTQHAQ